MTRLLSRVRSEDGQVVVLVAVFMLGLIGMTALVVDVGSWFRQQRATQSTVDAAALAGAQALHSAHSRCPQKHHEIESGHDRVAPAGERSAQDPIRAWQENVFHQPQAFGNIALLAIGGCGRQPEIVVAIVMRQREGVGECAAERGDACARGAHDMDAAGSHRFAR